MLNFLDEKFIILIGFILFVMCVYIILGSFIYKYLSGEAGKIIDNIELQKQELIKLKANAESAHKHLLDLEKEYQKKINSIVKENKSLIEQHKSMSKVSNSDHDKIKEYINQQFDDKLLEVKKNIVMEGVENIKNDMSKDVNAIDVKKINQKLENIL